MNTSQNREESRFGINLVAQFLASLLVTGIAFALPSALRSIFVAFGVLLNWSFGIGLLYGFFRLLGARAESLEWYYQNVPFGDFIPLALGHEVFPHRDEDVAEMVHSMRHTSQAGEAPSQHVDNRAKTSFSLPSVDWDLLLSINYTRYAGVLLIISAIFAFLFRIDWDLGMKILASFSGALLSMAIAEWFLRRVKETAAGICYLLAFVLLQFGCTLLFKWSLGSENSDVALLGDIQFWIFIKLIITGIAVVGLSRYRANFVPALLFGFAYLGPLSLLRVTSSIPLYPGLIFAVVMTAFGLFTPPLRNRNGVAIMNAICANAYALIFYAETLALSTTRWYPLPVVRSEALINASLITFVTLGIIFVLHLAAGVLRQKHSAEPDTEWPISVAEIFVTHYFSIFALLLVQTTHPELKMYHGLTILGCSIFTFCAHLVLVTRKIRNIYGEVLLNLAIVISAIGMFVQTEGTWTAVVFLVFSCVIVYGSFVLGTLRTRIYAFVALTISLFKLYMECSELFDTISGTAVILLIGVALLVISYKIESRKNLLAVAAEGKEKV